MSSNPNISPVDALLPDRDELPTTLASHEAESALGLGFSCFFVLKSKRWDVLARNVEGWNFNTCCIIIQVAQPVARCSRDGADLRRVWEGI